MIRFPDLAIIFLLPAVKCLSSQTCLESHIEKIAVKVSTDKDQIVAALFLSPGSIKFTLKEHVNTLKYEALVMVLDTQNALHAENVLPFCGYQKLQPGF
jgi:hypothetical protein